MVVHIGGQSLARAFFLESPPRTGAAATRLTYSCQSDWWASQSEKGKGGRGTHEENGADSKKTGRTPRSHTPPGPVHTLEGGGGLMAADEGSLPAVRRFGRYAIGRNINDTDKLPLGTEADELHGVDRGIDFVGLWKKENVYDLHLAIGDDVRRSGRRRGRAMWKAGTQCHCASQNRLSIGGRQIHSPSAEP